MARAEFKKELGELGYEVEELDADRVVFPYEIPCGRLTGQTLSLIHI